MGLCFALRCHLAIVIVHVVNCSAKIQESLNKLLLIFLKVSWSIYFPCHLNSSLLQTPVQKTLILAVIGIVIFIQLTDELEINKYRCSLLFHIHAY